MSARVATGLPTNPGVEQGDAEICEGLLGGVPRPIE